MITTQTPNTITGYVTTKQNASCVVATILFLIFIIPAIIYMVAASKDITEPFTITLSSRGRGYPPSRRRTGESIRRHQLGHEPASGSGACRLTRRRPTSPATASGGSSRPERGSTCVAYLRAAWDSWTGPEGTPAGMAAGPHRWASVAMMGRPQWTDEVPTTGSPHPRPSWTRAGSLSPSGRRLGSGNGRLARLPRAPLRLPRAKDVDAYSDPERFARSFGAVTMPTDGLRVWEVAGEGPARTTSPRSPAPGPTGAPGSNESLTCGPSRTTPTTTTPSRSTLTASTSATCLAGRPRRIAG